MRKDLQGYLVKEYPKLFAGFNKPPNQSLMCFGCDCGDGWFELIKEMCERIKDYPDVEFIQIKEKFGTLRVYTGSVPDEVSDIIDEMCSRSATVCELCGASGKCISHSGWVRCMCEECYKNKTKKKENK